MGRQHIIAEIQTPGRAFVRQVLPSGTRGTLRYNAASTAYLTVKDSHPVVAEVMQDGCRAAVWMVTVDGNTLTTRRLLEGPTGDLSGEGPFGTVTIPVIDDLSWFSGILGWQKPSASISWQTDEYARYTGPSETRALAAIAANVTRLGLPWNVPASEGRGSVGTTELRMHPLGDKIIPPLTADRLQITLERDRTTDRWDVRIREGDAYPRPLTAQSGVLGAWTWRAQRATATRGVVGGAGQGTARKFATVIDSAREASLHRILEVFDDSRMAEDTADLTPYGAEMLADAAAKAGITATLRETSWFRFPGAYDLGTKVNLQAGALTVDDVISQIDFSHTTGGGFTVTPKVGFAVDDPQERLTNFVAGLATSMRTLERN